MSNAQLYRSIRVALLARTKLTYSGEGENIVDLTALALSSNCKKNQRTYSKSYKYDLSIEDCSTGLVNFNVENLS